MVPSILCFITSFIPLGTPFVSSLYYPIHAPGKDILEFLLWSSGCSLVSMHGHWKSDAVPSPFYVTRRILLAQRCISNARSYS